VPTSHGIGPGYCPFRRLVNPKTDKADQPAERSRGTMERPGLEALCI
jgi:hypothetical protein